MNFQHWRGFLAESKRYMNHPDYWPERQCADYTKGGWTLADKQLAACKFWLRYPWAWLRFHAMLLYDGLRLTIQKYKAQQRGELREGP